MLLDLIATTCSRILIGIMGHLSVFVLPFQNSHYSQGSLIQARLHVLPCLHLHNHELVTARLVLVVLVAVAAVLLLH